MEDVMAKVSCVSFHFLFFVFFSHKSSRTDEIWGVPETRDNEMYHSKLATPPVILP